MLEAPDTDACNPLFAYVRIHIDLLPCLCVMEVSCNAILLLYTGATGQPTSQSLSSYA